VSKGKVLMGAVLALVLVVGLYFVNRFWIAPAVKIQAKASKEHPFAPDFSLTDISGKKLILSDYRGKVVMLDFWATWCEPCRIEIPWFMALQKRYASQGLVVIGISMDTGREPVVDFYRQFNMNYPVALGDARLEELYGGFLGLPTTFVIGRDGRIYAKHEGATDISVFEEEIKQLLGTPAGAEAVNFQRESAMTSRELIELGDPEEIDSEVPGVNLSKLTPAQKEAFKKVLAGQQCPCGCKLSLLKCRQVDRQCALSRKLAREQLDKFLKSSL
jgi:peroxiredoxin